MMVTKLFKSSKKNHVVVPTEVELMEAIENALRENPKGDANGIRKNILKNHSLWRVPKRRVQKSLNGRPANILPVKVNKEQAQTTVEKQKEVAPEAPKESAPPIPSVIQTNRNIDEEKELSDYVFKINQTLSTDATENQLFSSSFSDDEQSAGKGLNATADQVDVADTNTNTSHSNNNEIETSSHLIGEQYVNETPTETRSLLSNDNISDLNLHEYDRVSLEIEGQIETTITDYKTMNDNNTAFDAYIDDNDRKKEKLCQGCQNACVIL